MVSAPTHACVVARLIGSFTGEREAVNNVLFEDSCRRFLGSFGCPLEVLDAGLGLGAWLVHVLAAAAGNAFLFCLDIGVKAGRFQDRSATPGLLN